MRAGYEPIPSELEWVDKEDVHLVRQGPLYAQRYRACRLNDAGVPTKRGKGGGRWQLSTLRAILTNEAYAGTWHWNKTDQRGRRNKALYAGIKARPVSEWIAIDLEPIVAAEMIYAARAVLQRNREMAHQATKHEYVLRGSSSVRAAVSRMVGYAKGQAERTCYKCNNRYDLQRHLPLDERCPNAGQFSCEEGLTIWCGRRSCVWYPTISS